MIARLGLRRSPECATVAPRCDSVLLTTKELEVVSENTLYSVIEIRTLISKSQDDVAFALGVSRAFYSRLESGKRSWTLNISTRWLAYVLKELDKLPNGTVDFSKVLDFSDLNVLNESVNTSWQMERISL